MNGPMIQAIGEAIRVRSCAPAFGQCGEAGLVGSAGTTGGNAVVLAEAFECAVAPELHTTLATPHGTGSKYTIETARHRDLVAALRLPPFSVGLGYGYFQRGM